MSYPNLKRPEPPTCPYNEAVLCKYKEKPCSTCGWNPDVEKVRMKRIQDPEKEEKSNK